jgi:ankyrin repeat protein
MNRTYHAQFLILMAFVASSLFAMEPEKSHHDFSTIPKEVFLQICVKRDDKQPWEPLKHIATFKTVCKNWCAMISDDKTLADILRIPPMHYAAAMGNVDEIVRLKLKERHSVRGPDENMFSPCDYAVGMKQLKSLKILQMASALKEDDRSLLTLALAHEYSIEELSDALEHDQLETIEYILLQDRSKIIHLVHNKIDFKKLPLYSQRCKDRIKYAMQGILEQLAFETIYCNNAEAEFTEPLLNIFRIYDVNINAYNEQGFTLLHKACAFPEKFFITQFVLKCEGVDVNLLTKSVERNNCTPLQVAVSCKNSQATEALLATGRCDVNAVDKEYGTALHIAIENNDIACVKPLIDCKANIYSKNVTSQFGCETPIHLAARHKTAELLEYLCLSTHKCDINIKDSRGRTPLFYAVDGNSDACVEFLLNRGADVNIKTVTQRTFLHAAAVNNNIQCLPRLLAMMHHDAVNSTDTNGWAPLHDAARRGHVSIIWPLLNARAAINKGDALRGDTPMHYAASFGYVDVIRELFKYRADIQSVNNADTYFANTQNSCGNYTPLHFAAHKGHMDAVKTLVECNADIAAQTQRGKTALDVAKEQGHHDIVGFLSSQATDEKLH